MIVDYISTYNGNNYHFFDPKPEEICIDDIARALSMNCRYSGHVKHFYSVAEHSCHLHDIALEQTGDYEEAFCALMHDASEAYLTDIARPIKGHLDEYKPLERISERAIQLKFNCQPMTQLVKHLDTHVVGEEARQLFKTPPDWCNDYDFIPVTVKGWSPERAAIEFKERFAVCEAILKAKARQ